MFQRGHINSPFYLQRLFFIPLCFSWKFILTVDVYHQFNRHKGISSDYVKFSRARWEKVHRNTSVASAELSTVSLTIQIGEKCYVESELREKTAEKRK